MDEKLLGKCGFYCGCCPTYIKGGCKGCVDEHSKGDCYTRDCVLKQGIACCGACEQFPCDTIMTKPHYRFRQGLATVEEREQYQPIRRSI